jgi:hypothetical protein
MSTMTHARAGEQCCSPVTGGVDTHKDTHTAAVLDATGRLLGHHQFPASERIMQSALTYPEACEGDPSLRPPIPAVEMGRSLQR